MIITNHFLHTNEADRLAAIQKMNRRCVQQIHCMRSLNAKKAGA